MCECLCSVTQCVVEFSTITRKDGKVVYEVFTEEKLKELLDKFAASDEANAASSS